MNYWQSAAYYCCRIKLKRILLVLILLIIALIALVHLEEIFIYLLAVKQLMKSYNEKSYRSATNNLSSEGYVHPSDEFLKKIRVIHAERRNTLNKTCCQYGSCAKHPNVPHAKNMYSDTYKVNCFYFNLL